MLNTNFRLFHVGRILFCRIMPVTQIQLHHMLPVQLISGKVSAIQGSSPMQGFDLFFLFFYFFLHTANMLELRVLISFWT